jgi:uncharacterized protein
MSRGLSRRQLMLAGGAAWLGGGTMGRVLARSQSSPKKVLFFIKSAGFPHSVVTRPSNRPSHAEQILIKIGKEHGFEVHATKDGRLFEPGKIGEWDAFVFETTGNLTTEGTIEKSPAMSPDGEKALYDAIRGGKGFLGMHCATDTFGRHPPRNRGPVDPYIQMIGAEFAGHGKQQEVEIDVVDPKFPGVAEGFGGSGRSFRFKDEWYGLKNIADDLHVILVQVTKGMEGREYQRPNYPMTWARNHGKGRVFYTSMGHREDVWENPMYQGLLLGALGWATGRVDADVTPNIKDVTPEYNKLHL